MGNFCNVCSDFQWNHSSRICYWWQGSEPMWDWRVRCKKPPLLTQLLTGISSVHFINLIWKRHIINTLQGKERIHKTACGGKGNETGVKCSDAISWDMASRAAELVTHRPLLPEREILPSALPSSASICPLPLEHLELDHGESPSARAGTSVGALPLAVRF